MVVNALIASLYGQRLVRDSLSTSLEKIHVGKKIAARLLKNGGQEILNELN